MPSPKAARTTRRLLKLASLGLAGLIAGLLSGCPPHPPPPAAWLPTPSPTVWTASAALTNRAASTPIPSPISGTLRPPTESNPGPIAPPPGLVPFSSQINADPTLTDYAFTGASAPSNRGTGHLTVQ